MIEWVINCTFVCMFPHCESKKQDSVLLSVMSPDVNLFPETFHCYITLCIKFVIKPYLNTPPDLSCVSLYYLVKYLCSKNRHTQEVIEANCHVT